MDKECKSGFINPGDVLMNQNIKVLIYLIGSHVQKELYNYLTGQVCDGFSRDFNTVTHVFTPNTAFSF